MKLDPILRKAVKFARHGNYTGAVQTLEPEINRYRGSFRYYYLLGVSCLYSGDFGGALTWFRLAHEAKSRDPLPLLGLAVLYLRRGETDRAVDFYLDAQELDSKNRIVKKALAVIRKHAGADTFSAWLDSGRLPGLYPPVPSAGISAAGIGITAAAIAAALLFAFGILVKCRVLPNPFSARPSRSIPAETALSREERSGPVQSGGVYRYIVTRDQALKSYEKALSLFTAYHDEAAKLPLNRILESNASESIKNKARLLFAYMETPGFDTFKREDNTPYREAAAEPVLYRDVCVIWRGMATNVEPDGRAFDFLVGYDTRKTLEGIVRVQFDEAVELNQDRPLEVLGRITPVLSSGGETIRLAGIAIHQSGRLENPQP